MNTNIDLFISWTHKSIRRSLQPFNLEQISGIILSGGRRLSDRLPTIALEDIGPANPYASISALGINAGIAWQPLPTKAQLLLSSINEMAKSPKSRDGCDLTNAMDHAQGSVGVVIHNLAVAPTSDLVDLAVDQDSPLTLRTAAIAYLGGTNRWRQVRLPHRTRDDAALIEALNRLNLDEGDRTVIHLAAKRLSHMLFAGHAISLALKAQSRSAQMQTQTFLPCPLLNEIPAYVFDTYTEIGRTSIRNFSNSNDKLRSIAPRMSNSARARAISLMVFVVEGGLLQDRLIFDQSLEIEDLAFATESGALGLQLNQAFDLRDAVRDCLDDLHQHRFDCLTKLGC